MQKFELNPLVDKYLIDGCMRCKYGATPNCKVLKWTEILETLRQIALESGLSEEIKWGVPVYTKNGKNVLNISALKDAALIGFFKGALLKDEAQILEQQGNIQAARIIRFTQLDEVLSIENHLKNYMREAIALEESGKKVVTVKNPEPIPQELLDEFQKDESFKNAFYSLTQGRQRAYIIHFSQPKQSQTRLGRIEKYKSQILDGIGFHDLYKQNKA